ncbi:hypothetical protein [Homoserinibacter sp. YIM 151385]|uniref:hypothetical protein n=1 Tax=Homoserinibacter sp. YIM 151385 TaxID=2985506 RepID=UPI0022F011D3|nr:hypothetical protein [Homoserinibacter sp. YIM 151385]WBU37006.1 hypothetical protein OF852_08705 [Homoserinibacter sp. YIM 151385]
MSEPMPDRAAGLAPRPARSPAPRAAPDIEVPPPGARDAGAATRAPRARRVGSPRLPGILALVLAVVQAVLVGAGVEIALAEPVVATVLAIVAMAAGVAAVVCAVIALVRRRTRLAAIAGLVLAVLGNPLVLTYGLRLLGGL